MYMYVFGDVYTGNTNKQYLAQQNIRDFKTYAEFITWYLP
jgi:hypothetical protein